MNIKFQTKKNYKMPTKKTFLRVQAGGQIQTDPKLINTTSLNPFLPFPNEEMLEPPQWREGYSYITNYIRKNARNGEQALKALDSLQEKFGNLTKVGSAELPNVFKFLTTIL